MNERLMKTPAGSLLIREEDGFIKRVDFVDDTVKAKTSEASSVLDEAERQLKAYFQGERRDFDLPLKVDGTEFQSKAWKALQTIPFGTTRTYGEQARSLGNAKASRAVGGANNKNPISIIIPCHRVVGANGKLVGYASGLDRKQWLLDHEAKCL